jgi:hypothetical protein
MTPFNNIFEIADFLSPQEIEQVESSANQWTMVDHFSNGGKYATGTLIAKQAVYNWNDQDPCAEILKSKLDTLFDSYRVAEIVLQQLHLPWDVHTDYVRPGCVTEPYYSIILPLTECDSRTILFDQTATYNDFYKFKQVNQKIANAVDLDFWRNNLSHCWDEDREYLSLRYVSRSWRRGDLFSFRRNILHSSDNFHTRMSTPKRFIQILIDKI